jgi:primary-amine oxidase
MDPDTGWYFRTYMDAGEYGVGKFTPPLQVGVDCPAYATYMEAVLADDKGVPSSQPNAVCLFERTAGDIAWRHFEIAHGQTESRRGRELVMRYIAAIGNYDYFFDWVFRQDGSINIAVGTSGIEQVQAVTAPVMAEAQPTEDLAYGHLVAPHTLAIHHDHFFNFRLDLSVDSTQNSLLIGELTPVALGLESPRRSTYTVRSRVAKTEQEAKLHVSTDRPALWRVINPQRSGPLGYPVSYQLVASHPAMSLLSPQDYPQRRAGFTGYYLWVTPFHPEERYARGMYPSQSHGGDGLPHWTQANRAVDNADIVLRYTLGLHHVVRAEDWPVMPTVWHGFELRPFDFFARNPALDLPR